MCHCTHCVWHSNTTPNPVIGRARCFLPFLTSNNIHIHNLRFGVFILITNCYWKPMQSLPMWVKNVWMYSLRDHAHIYRVYINAHTHTHTACAHAHFMGNATFFNACLRQKLFASVMLSVSLLSFCFCVFVLAFHNMRWRCLYMYTSCTQTIEMRLRLHCDRLTKWE